MQQIVDFQMCSFQVIALNVSSQCGKDKYRLYFLKSRNIFRFCSFQTAVILTILNTCVGSLAVGFQTNGQITMLDVVVVHFSKIN